MNHKNIQISLYCAAMGLCLLAYTPVWSGTVTGIMLMRDSTPMANGKVIVFIGDEGPPPQLSDDSRIPDYVEDLDKEGAFKIQLEAGTYYFGALQWLDGRGPGKPVIGDNFFLMRNQPVQVPAEGLVDLGAILKGETLR